MRRECEIRQRFRTCALRRVQPRILVGILLQISLVLPVMPSEKGAGVRRDAGKVDRGGRTASAFHVHDSKDVAAVISISSRIVEATLPHRASMRA